MLGGFCLCCNKVQGRTYIALKFCLVHVYVIFILTKNMIEELYM
jgi:hypothetical protein